MHNPNQFPKHNVPVRMTLADGSHVLGIIYLRQGQRISDMLCDDREFFPLKSATGVILLNKRNVMQVDVMTIDEMIEKGDLFPDMSVTYLSNNAW
jgi:hypothetical protein